jgi:hypothetical protein
MRIIKSSLSILVFTAFITTVVSCRKENENELIVNATEKNLPAVENNVCGSLQYSNPETKNRMEEMERAVQLHIAHEDANSRTSEPVTIPVVFHVVYNLPAQNISDAQLQSQIDVLNEDFSGANTDIVNVPACFQPLIGNANLQFVLAKQDPNGNSTNGITRTSTSVASFSSDGSVCHASLGGCDAWPAGEYLNIWVCNKTGAAGFSSYPWSGNPASDGIIAGYNYIGRTGTFTNNWNYQKGRTITHEVGHWFGLVHIWGDAVCGDDLVGDTPIQTAANGSSPLFPHLSSCNTNPNGDMFMNYMDYTYDASRTMFSIGQATRMNSYLDLFRTSIKTSLGGIAPGSETCNVPAGLNATGITSGTASLSWSSTGALSYMIKYKPVSSSSWITASTSATSAVISGLSSSTAYEFQVQSVCDGNSSAYSSSSTFTTSAIVLPCIVPSGLAASFITAGSAVLGWNPTGALSYTVKYKSIVSSSWITASGLAIPSFSVSGLSASTTYEFQVQGTCADGASSYSASATFTTSAPISSCDVPAGLTVSLITSVSATLNWVSTGAISYSIRYKATSSGTWISISSPATSFNVSGLSANTAYEFQVQSVCATGSSSYSPSKTFTTKKHGHSIQLTDN